jgi:cytochrome c553
VAQRIGVGDTPLTGQLGGVVPRVAWRAFEDSAGETVVVHQLHADVAIPTSTLAYYAGGDTPGPVVSTLTILDTNGSVLSDQILFPAVLPVDVAISPDRQRVLVAAPGNALAPDLRTVLYVPFEADVVGDPILVPPLPGPAIAVAFDGRGDALAQTREPAALWLVYPGTSENVPIPLSTISRADTGHEVFHAQAGALIACASCHPEGGDDGHVWNFGGDLRRTASLRGTIGGTAPYHWPGDEPDFPALVADVYTTRMGGAKLPSAVTSALQGWVEAIPAPPAPSWVDAASARRGQALFAGASTGCTTCHTGPKLTDNMTIDVGTGGAFQVPPLVGVGWRTPLLHDGCAATLTDRFTTCATSAHGTTSALSAQDVTDLVSYLQTL